MQLPERQLKSRFIKPRWTLRTQFAVLVCIVIPTTWLIVYLAGQNDLPIRRGAANIFFIETTCGIKEVPWRGLSPRQACAVESAVRHHPGRPVYLLHTCAAPSGLALPAGATAVHVTTAQLLRDTPLYKPFLIDGQLAQTRWPVHQASNIIRLVVLWKYGGLYLDLDFVVLRDMSELGEEWVTAEDRKTVANSAMCLSARPGSAGQQLAAAYVEKLQTDYDGQTWGHNGGGMLTRLLLMRCGADTVPALADCGWMRVLPPALLYPVPFLQWRRYFSAEDANSTLADVRKAFAVHAWNYVSASTAVPQTSAYATVARENCPDAFSLAEGRF